MSDCALKTCGRAKAGIPKTCRSTRRARARSARASCARTVRAVGRQAGQDGAQAAPAQDAARLTQRRQAQAVEAEQKEAQHEHLAARDQVDTSATPTRSRQPDQARTHHHHHDVPVLDLKTRTSSTYNSTHCSPLPDGHSSARSWTRTSTLHYSRAYRASKHLRRLIFGNRAAIFDDDRIFHTVQV